LDTAKEHYINVREISLVFLQMPGGFDYQIEYGEILAKWALCSKLETVNPVMMLDFGDRNPVFTDFDSVRRYFQDITTLRIKCNNPYEHRTVEARHCCPA